MRPLLAITLGDPAGVGPEIAVKALANPDVYQQCRPLMIGEGCILQQALITAGLLALAFMGFSGLSVF